MLSSKGCRLQDAVLFVMTFILVPTPNDHDDDDNNDDDDDDNHDDDDDAVQNTKKDAKTMQNDPITAPNDVGVVISALLVIDQSMDC